MPEIAEKKDIRTISIEEIKNFLSEKNEKPFRAKQVYEWLWKKSATTFSEMSNLAKSTRELLEQNFVINAIKITGR